MEFSNILPVLTLILGWLLNEASRYLGIRKEKRESIAQAISDLLEVRHQIVAIRTVVEQLTERFNIPPEVRPMMTEFYRQLIPLPEDLSKRYDNAVTIIASTDPILGFQLRSKNLFGEYMSKLSLLINADKRTRLTLVDFETKLENMIIPQLEESILNLSKKHSPRTWFQVRRLLKKKLELPEEVDNIWRDMQEKLGSYEKNTI